MVHQAGLQGNSRSDGACRDMVIAKVSLLCNFAGSSAASFHLTVQPDLNLEAAFGTTGLVLPHIGQFYAVSTWFVQVILRGRVLLTLEAFLPPPLLLACSGMSPWELKRKGLIKFLLGHGAISGVHYNSSLIQKPGLKLDCSFL